MLSKWYMDCVTDAGDVFIGYAATVGSRALSINYSSILEQQNAEAPTAHTSLRFAAPEVSGSTITWSSPSLKVIASWTALSPPMERTIFESESGEIEWRCIAPIADAEVYLQDQPCRKGLGYV